MDRVREPEEGHRVHLLNENDQKGVSALNPSADFSCNPSEQASQCNIKANCIRFDNGGYCCECQPNYFGNGVQCRLKGIVFRSLFFKQYKTFVKKKLIFF